MALPKLMSKLTIQQNIPNGWKETKLSELLVEVNERNRERAELPVLSVTNSRGFVLQSEQFARNLHSKNTSNYKIVSKEQFAYNPARINVGSIALLRKWEKGLLSPMYVVFGTKDELLNDYLQYYIQSPRFGVQVSNNTAGSVRKSLNFNAFEHFDYVYPESKREQKKIVEVLASVDEDIKKTQEVIKSTERLKKGLMQKLFTQGIGHKKFKKTDLGEIPESWEALPLNDVCIKIGDGLHGTPEYTDNSEFYFINGNNLVDWSIKILPSTKCISEEEFNLHKKDLDQNTVLISINGTIGNVALYNGEPVALGKSVAYMTCSEKLNRLYLAYQLESNQIQNYFTKQLTGSTIKNLSLRTIRETQVSVPDLDEQKEIVSILSAVDEKILVNKKLLAKQTKLKKGLMQDLLSGVKRVKV